MAEEDDTPEVYVLIPDRIPRIALRTGLSETFLWEQYHEYAAKNELCMITLNDRSTL